jgi:hypothetical protein
MITPNEWKPFISNDSNDYIRIKNAVVDTIQSNLQDNPSYGLFFTTTRLKYIGRWHYQEPEKEWKVVSGLDGLEWKLDYPFLGEGTWKTYKKCFTYLVSQLDNNWTKKTYLLPLTYDFLDVGGTRETRRPPLDRNTIPHIHSIYLVHSDLLNRWNGLMSKSFKKVTDHPKISDFVDSFHAEPIDDYDLPKIVSYASKFYDVEQMRAKRDDYQLYYQHGPIGADGKEALKQEREQLPFYAEVQAKRKYGTEFIKQNPQLEGWWAG